MSIFFFCGSILTWQAGAKDDWRRRERCDGWAFPDVGWPSMREAMGFLCEYGGMEMAVCRQDGEEGVQAKEGVMQIT